MLNNCNKNDSIALGFGLSDIYIEPKPILTDENSLKNNAQFQMFCEDVYATLHSQIQGFPDIYDLMRCYNFDTGKDPLEMAEKFGFKSFTAFLNCDEMKEFVLINYTGNNEATYHAVERDLFSHIRQEQLESFRNVCLKRARREGYCDSKRVRPKLFEVAKIGGMFFDNNLSEAKRPNVLTRSGPAADSNRNASLRIWNEDLFKKQNSKCSSHVNYADEDDIEVDAWTKQLYNNVLTSLPTDGNVNYNVEWVSEIKDVEDSSSQTGGWKSDEPYFNFHSTYFNNNNYSNAFNKSERCSYINEVKKDFNIT